MKYRIIPPCDELKGVISHFWAATWDAKSRAPNMVYYIIANTLTNITFAFDSANKHSELLFSAIEGHTHLPQQLPVAGFYHLTGVSVHSYALPFLFNTPSSDLSNKFLSLTTFLGHEGSVLNEKTALANSIDRRIEILSKYFIALLKEQGKEDRLMTNAVKEIRKYNGYIKVMKMAADFNLSQRQFNRRFKEFSGFNPKMYARIARFESIIKNYSSLSALTELSHSKGYYDQAHFNHEFKAFTGFKPKDFWKLNDKTS